LLKTNFSEPQNGLNQSHLWIVAEGYFTTSESLEAAFPVGAINKTSSSNFNKGKFSSIYFWNTKTIHSIIVVFQVHALQVKILVVFFILFLIASF
jgi:hypothetical protein